MFFYNLLFAFTMPVVLPSLMGRYGIMEHYAVLGGLNALLSCIITPLGGKLGDRFGRRRVGLVASVIRLVLLLACTIPTSGSVFFALYLTGNAAGAVLSSFPYAILGDITSLEERPRWFGLFGTINGIALLAGLLGGGVIVDLLGPFSSFLFFAPFGILSVVLLAWYYPNQIRPDATAPDLMGITLLVSGLSLILIWCNFGGTVFPRFSPGALCLLAAGAVLLAVLIWYEPHANDPLLNPKFFHNRNFTLSFITYLAIAPMVCLCSSTLVMYGQIALGLSATASGTLALPKNIIFFLLPAFLGTWLSKGPHRFRSAFLLCGGTIALGSLLCTFWDTKTSIWTIYGVMVIFGIGTSLQSVCIQPYMQRGIPAQELGSAISVIQFANSIGVVLFTSVYSILYNARYLAAIQPGGQGPAAAVAQTFSGLAFLSTLAGICICAATLHFIPSARKSNH